MTIERMLIGTARIGGDPYFSNVSLLLHGNGTNGSQSFPDNSSNNFSVTAYGNAQVSTSVKKYGTGSMYFDGDGDRLVAADAAPLNFIGDFTIELWVYATVVDGYADIILTKGDAVVGAGEWAVWFFSSRITFYASGFQLNSINTVTTNTWYHVAVTRSGSTVRLFVDGVLQSSGTSSNNFTSTKNLAIGDREAGSLYGQYPFNGYIDDLRITKGVARYIANFTPPTQAFPNY